MDSRESIGEAELVENNDIELAKKGRWHGQASLYVSANVGNSSLKRRVRLRFAATMKSKSLCALVLLVLVVTTWATPPVNPEEAARYARIQDGMKKLLPLVGKWDVAVDFHNPDGTTTKQIGTWTVTSMLDDTYLEFDTERHIQDNLRRHRLVLFFVTFNPKTSKYDITFFYNWSALRVTETGNFDNATQQFRTRGYIPDEDGVNDETVAETFDLKDPTRILYKHYSMRSPRETTERLDEEMIVTRPKPTADEHDHSQ